MKYTVFGVIRQWDAGGDSIRVEIRCTEKPFQYISVKTPKREITSVKAFRKGLLEYLTGMDAEAELYVSASINLEALRG